MSDENQAVTGNNGVGVDSAHETLSRWWIMKVKALCKGKEDIKHSYFNGGFVSIGSFVLYMCSSDLHKVFLRGS